MRWTHDGWKTDGPPSDDHAAPYLSLEPYEVFLLGGGHVSVEMASCASSARVLAEKRSGINRRWLMAERSKACRR